MIHTYGDYSLGSEATSLLSSEYRHIFGAFIHGLLVCYAGAGAGAGAGDTPAQRSIMQDQYQDDFIKNSWYILVKKLTVDKAPMSISYPRITRVQLKDRQSKRTLRWNERHGSFGSAAVSSVTLTN